MTEEVIEPTPLEEPGTYKWDGTTGDGMYANGDFMMNRQRDRRALAKMLAERGYYIVPMKVGVDEETEKRIVRFPFEGSWRDYSSNDPDTVEAFDWESANRPAIDTERSGVVVLDLDNKGNESGIDQWFELAEAHNDDPEMGFYGKSRSGMHVFFGASQMMPTRSTTGEVAPNIDVRAEGGLVFCYPDYQHMPPVDFVRRQTVPSWILALNKSERLQKEHPTAPPKDARYSEGSAGTRYGLKALEASLSELQDRWDSDDGTFNHTLNHTAFSMGQLVGGGELEKDSTYQTLWEWLVAVGAPNDQYKTLDSGFYSGHKRPRSSEDVGEDEEYTDEEYQAFAERVLDHEGLLNLPDPEWLVEEWLEIDSVARLNGPSGCGKSFIALDLAYSVANGRSWMGQEVRQGPVFYLVAEGARGMRKRALAWSRYHGIEPSDVHFLPNALQIRDKAWELLVRYVKDSGCKLVILDTQARVTVGVEENSATEMGEIIHRLDQLKKETGACVLLVHHTGHEKETGRGSTAVKGAMETELGVKKSAQGVKLSCSKQKNSEEPDQVSLKFKQVEETDSVVLVPASNVSNTRAGAMDQQAPDRIELTILEALHGAQESLTIPKIASITGHSQPTVRSRLSRLLRRERVEEHEIEVNGGTQTARAFTTT